jgi:MFS family permease
VPTATAATATATGGATPTQQRRTGRRDLVGALAFAAAVVVVAAAQIGGTVLLVLLVDGGGVTALLLGALGLALLTIAPIVLGAVLAAWDVPTTHREQQRARRLLGWMLGVQAGGAALVLLSAWLSDPPAWLPASFVALGAALTVVALVAGPAVGEHVRQGAEPVEWRQVPRGEVRRGEVRRGVRTVTLAFVLTFVPAAVGLSFVPLDDDDSGADLLFVAAGLGFLAASIACTVVSFRLMKQAGAVIGRDHDRARRIGKAVLSRRPLELGPDDERAAARWASVSAVSLPVQYAQSATLFAGLICNQLPKALGEDGWIFSRVLMVVMAAMLLGFAPFFLTRASRARRYAAARAHLLPPSAAETAGTAGSAGTAGPSPVPGGERS